MVRCNIPPPLFGTVAMPTRNIVLSEAQESLISDLVESGRYRNAGEVIRAGLHLLQGSEAQLPDLHADLVDGLPQATGEMVDGDKAVEQASANRRV